MTEFRSDFRQGLEHKTAFVHCRMRNGEGGCIHDRSAKQQNVDINCARAFRLRAATAHFLLDGKSSREELFWHQLGFDSDNTVQEPWLSLHFDRLCLIQRRSSYH